MPFEYAQGRLPVRGILGCTVNIKAIVRSDNQRIAYLTISGKFRREYLLDTHRETRFNVMLGTGKDYGALTLARGTGVNSIPCTFLKGAMRLMFAWPEEYNLIPKATDLDLLSSEVGLFFFQLPIKALQYET